MKLTPHLVSTAPSYINPVQDRVLILRGLKAQQIENLGVTNDSVETIDLTDNEIETLGNIPLSRRLKTLLVAQNKISSVDPTFYKSVPNLRQLNLCSNNLTDLHAVADALSGLESLHTLVLKDNPVAEVHGYRAHVISRIPSLCVLDFEKVKAEERKGTVAADADADAAPPAAEVDYTDVRDRRSRKLVQKLSDSERRELETRLASATSLDEIETIENALQGA